MAHFRYNVNRRFDSHISYLSFTVLNPGNISTLEVFVELAAEIRRRVHERYGPENERSLIVEFFPANGVPSVCNTLRHVDGVTGLYLSCMFQHILHSQENVVLIGSRIRIKVVGTRMQNPRARGSARGFGRKFIPKEMKSSGISAHPRDDECDAPCLIKAFLLAFDPTFTKRFADWKFQATALATTLAVDGLEMSHPDTDRIVALPPYRHLQIVILNTMKNIDYVAKGGSHITQTDRRVPDPYTLFILHHENHYWWVQHVGHCIFYQKAQRGKHAAIPCYVCYQAFSPLRFNQHRCSLAGSFLFQCSVCTCTFACEGALERHQRQKSGQTCEKCGRADFWGSDCFLHHQQIECVVEGSETCPECGRQFLTNHSCQPNGSCSNCKTVFESKPHARQHRCYMQRTKKFHCSLTEKKWQSHWFYDFETYRESEEDPDVYVHSIMAWCMELLIPDDTILQFIQTSEFIEDIGSHDHMEVLPDTIRFKGIDLASFIHTCETILSKNRRKKRSWNPTFWAHNGAKFDSKFILDHYLIDQGVELAGASYVEEFDNLIPNEKGKWRKETYTSNRRDVLKLTMVGTRALGITLKNMKFQCSYAHLSAPLRNLPAMFDLPDAIKKGEFPYGRLKPENWGRLLPFPSLEEYDLQSKSRERKEEIEQWYATQDTSLPWDFSKELWEYLEADVRTGRKAMEAHHRQSRLLQRSLHPTDYISPLDFKTTPAFSLAIYRTWFLPEESVSHLKWAEAKYIRNSLRGGRTDKRVNWIKPEPHQTIDYVDFTSLYPSVMKTEVHDTHYPIGTPHWLQWRGPITNAQLLEKMENLTGYLTITCHPTKYVTHPTLHSIEQYDESVREKRLIFAIAPQERSTYGWPEIQEALRCNEIAITHVHEGLLFMKGSPFTGFVDFFFQVKEDAERENNQGKRTLAKLMLNALWGKLGQRCYAEREWITDQARKDYIWKKFATGEFILKGHIDKSDSRIYVTYEKREDFYNLESTAHQLAAFVSMWGRIITHQKILTVHGQRALYYDTDSGIILRETNDPVPYMGRGLGMLVSELPKIAKGMNQPRIQELVCLAPKTYSLKIQDADGLIKYKDVCKGFELSVGNSEKINFQAMKDLVFTQFNINESLKRQREDEETVITRNRIEGETRLAFISSLHTQRIAPRERQITKTLTGIYCKGQVHPYEARLTVPYCRGRFKPGVRTIFNTRAFIE